MKWRLSGIDAGWGRGLGERGLQSVNQIIQGIGVEGLVRETEKQVVLGLRERSHVPRGAIDDLQLALRLGYERSSLCADD